MSQFHDFESNIVIGSRTGGGRRATSPQDDSTKDANKPGMGKALSAFRSLGRQKRGSLARGPKLEIRSHDSQVLASLPLALFNTLSTMENLVSMEKGIYSVICAEHLLPVAIKDLIARITPLANPNIDVVAMDSTGNLFKDIQIASAADFLGLTAYTQRMFNAHWATVKTCIPSEALVTTISKIRTPLGDKLLDILAHRTAEMTWDGDHNDTNFEECLQDNERFDGMVKAFLSKWEASSKAFEAREANRRARAERRDLSAERRRETESRALAKAQKERANERAVFAAKAKEEAEVGKAVRAKIQAKGLRGSKFSPREVSYIYSHMGKRVPVSSG